MFMEIVNAYAMDILQAIVLAIAGCLGLALRKLATRYINTELKRTLAKTAAMFVEQAYKGLHGPDKLDKALQYVREMLAKNGIAFDPLEMTVLIEAAVGEFNEAFSQPLLIAEGIDVDDMTDEQLRAVLEQIGRPAPVSFTREELLAALDEAAEQANT